MFSSAVIARMARESAQRAAQERQQPFVYATPEEVDDFARFPFPNLGDYCPFGWRMRDDTLFCDATGLDRSGLSLSPEKLKAKIKEILMEEQSKPNHLRREIGFGIIEAGQFQLYVGVFQKVNKRGKA